MKDTKTYVWVLFFIATAGFLVQFFLNMFLTHHLGIRLYGDYSLAIQLLGVFVSVSLLGTDIGSQCFVVKYLQSNKSSKAEEYISWNLKLVGVSFLIIRLVAAIALILMLGLHFLGIRDIHQYNIIFYVLWITPLAASFKLFSSFLIIGDLVFTMMILSKVLIYVLELLFFFIVINFFSVHTDYVMIVAVLAVSNFLLAVITYYFLNIDFVHMIRLGLNQFKITHIVHPSWAKQSMRLILSNLTYLLICSADLFIVKLFSSNMDHVGQYSVDLTITSFVWLISGNLYQGLKPTMSYELGSAQGRFQLQHKLDQINKIVFTLITVVCFLIMCFSKQLLLLFGEKYLQGQSALLYLTVGTWFASITQIANFVLIYANLEGLAVTISVIELVVILITTIPATYWFGMDGTAISLSIILAVANLTSIYFVKRKLGIRAICIPSA